MEGPAKRPRLSLGEEPEDGYNDVDLSEARAQNDLRLKSIFEGIFEKYGKDFTEVGDEINLETGEIFVNNGHLNGMEGENDTGENGWGLEPGFASENEGEVEDGTEEGQGEGSEAPLGLSTAADDLDAGKDVDEDDDRSSVDSLLDCALSVQNGLDGSLKFKKPDANKPTQQATPLDASIQPHIPRPAPTDSLWQVPEISGLSTPMSQTTRPKPILKNPMRSASPPGTGSLWTLPKRGRPSTGIPEEKKRKSQQNPRVKKRKTGHLSSPAVLDWSFAETPDGSESDDPLQEDEPSPSPRKALHIRGKRIAPASPSRVNKGGNSGLSKTAEAQEQLNESKVVKSQPAVTKSSPLPAQKPSPLPVQKPTATPNPKINESKKDTVFKSQNAVPKSSPLPVQKPSIDTLNSAINNTPQTSTPTSNKRIRVPMTPGEAKTIITMRQVENKRYKDILELMPTKKELQLIQWMQIHWTNRQVKPPRLTKPWSQADRVKLNNIKDQDGLTWSDIRAELPDRNLGEIEFELLRLWAGEDGDGERSSSPVVPSQEKSLGREVETKSPQQPHSLNEGDNGQEKPSGQEATERKGPQQPDTLNREKAPESASLEDATPTPQAPSSEHAFPSIEVKVSPPAKDPPAEDPPSGAPSEGTKDTPTTLDPTYQPEQTLVENVAESQNSPPKALESQIGHSNEAILDYHLRSTGYHSQNNVDQSI